MNAKPVSPSLRETFTFTVWTRGGANVDWCSMGVQ